MVITVVLLYLAIDCRHVSSIRINTNAVDSYFWFWYLQRGEDTGEAGEMNSSLFYV